MVNVLLNVFLIINKVICEIIGVGCEDKVFRECFNVFKFKEGDVFN